MTIKGDDARLDEIERQLSTREDAQDRDHLIAAESDALEIEHHCIFLDRPATELARREIVELFATSGIRVIFKDTPE